MLVSNLPALCVVPIIDFPARLIPSVAISLLDFALELILLAIDYVEIIIREFAPFLFDLAFHLLPASFNAIPIHSGSPS
jgi:hypothetical protein